MATCKRERRLRSLLKDTASWSWSTTSRDLVLMSRIKHIVGYSFTLRLESRNSHQRELTLGMNVSSSLIVGKWGSKEKREGFLENIVKRVPDFHQQRRKLFEEFALTWYVMPKDLEFSVEASKFHVATSFWQKNPSTLKPFVRKWKKEIEKAGGKILLELTEGYSPTGYYFNPDVFLIIEWQDRTAFDAFAKAHPLSTYEDLKHVHQVVIQ